MGLRKHEGGSRNGGIAVRTGTEPSLPDVGLVRRAWRSAASFGKCTARKRLERGLRRESCVLVYREAKALASEVAMSDRIYELGGDRSWQMGFTSEQD